MTRRSADTRLKGPADAAHLLNRTAFGPRPGEVERLLEQGLDGYLERQLHPAPDHESLDRKIRALPTVQLSPSEIVLLHQRDRLSRSSIECPLDDLRTAKCCRAVESENQLAEVMSDFWFNHFNVYVYAWEPSVPQYELHVIRPRIFGRFADLLAEVARSPAMTYYLDTFISKADRVVNGTVVRGVNENYGRELLELHTVGVDAGYTQHDVVDAARCFTGWDFGGWHAPVYEFRFAHDNHDTDRKHVFGIDLPAGGGVQDGERLIAYLAAHPKTAHFISRRLVQRFVDDRPPQSLVRRCAEVFLRSDGRIADVLSTIFRSDEFWSPGTRRNKTKSPFEYVMSAVRAVNGRVEDAKPLSGALSDMGMPLYECKPPTGYSNRSSDWVNVSSQLHRINFALALGAGTIPGISAGSDFLQNPQEAVRRFAGQILGGQTLRGGDRIARVKGSKGVPAGVKARGLLLASPEFQAR